VSFDLIVCAPVGFQRDVLFTSESWAPDSPGRVEQATGVGTTSLVGRDIYKPVYRLPKLYVPSSASPPTVYCLC
jgi:hypothetical protein